MAIHQVVVVGGGISGLTLALYLNSAGRVVTLVERDPPPPELNPSQAFEQWDRPGVPQFRHAHMFLARLQTMFRDDHPVLHQELITAGLELSQLNEVLPESQIETFPFTSEAAELSHFWGRRATLEYVLCKHVARLPGVRFIHGATVDKLLAKAEGEGVRVCGVAYVRGGRRHQLDADLVVDASGKRSRSREWLSALGVSCDESANVPTGRHYVCRHYRLKDDQPSPPRRGTGGTRDFFGYAAFYAEDRHFALSLSCPQEETALASHMRRPDGFEEICRAVPELRPWLDRSVPVSKVLGAGDFRNRWTRFGTGAGRSLLGFVAIGDAHVETNPIYGRGCASACMQAKLLAEVLRRQGDNARGLSEYYERFRSEMQMHFDFCVDADRLFRTGGRRARGELVEAGDAMVQWLFEHAWTPALKRSPVVALEMVKAVEMRDRSHLGVRLMMLANLARAGGVSLMLRKKMTDPAADREGFLSRLGLDPAVDRVAGVDASEAVAVEVAADGTHR